MLESKAATLAPFEYATLRLVPRVERGEYLNVGVMVICRAHRFLNALVALDRQRLTVFAPYLDVETIDLLERQLSLIPRICVGDRTAGPIATLSLSERWHWLAAPVSTTIQPGVVHTGLCVDPAVTLDCLFRDLVQVPTG